VQNPTFFEREASRGGFASQFLQRPLYRCYPNLSEGRRDLCGLVIVRWVDVTRDQSAQWTQYTAYFAERASQLGYMREHPCSQYSIKTIFCEGEVARISLNKARRTTQAFTRLP
jgi:hypothetical protein